MVTVAERAERAGRALLEALWREWSSDAEVEHQAKRDARREEVLPELRAVVEDFTEGRASLKEFRDRMQQFSLQYQDLWGFNGYGGQMTLNQLEKTATPDDEPAIRAAFAPPADLDQAQQRVAALAALWKELRERKKAAGSPGSAPAPGNAPFVLSFLWEAFDPDLFPVYFLRTREGLKALGLFTPTGDPEQDYRRFAEAVARAREALGVGTWDVEHACYWHGDHPFVGFVSADFEFARDNERLNREAWNSRSGYATADDEQEAKENVRRLQDRLRWLADDLRTGLGELLPDHPLKLSSERASLSGEGRYRSEAWLFAAIERPGGGEEGPGLRIQVSPHGVHVGIHPGSLDDEARLQLLDAAEQAGLAGDDGFMLRQPDVEAAGVAAADPAGDALLVARQWSPDEAVTQGRSFQAALLGAARELAPLLKAFDRPSDPPPAPGRRAWLVRGEVDGEDRTPTWIKQGYVAVGWAGAGAMPSGTPKAQISERLAATHDDTPLALATATGCLHKFLNLMTPGDLVLALGATDFHVGVIDSEPYWHAGAPDARRRDTRWRGHAADWRKRQLPKQLTDKFIHMVEVGEITQLRDEVAGFFQPDGDPEPEPLGFDPDVVHLYVKLADLDLISAEDTVASHGEHAVAHGAVWFMGNWSVAGKAEQFRAAIKQGKVPVLCLGQRAAGLVAFAPILDVRSDREPVPCPDPAYLPEVYDTTTPYRTWVLTGPFTAAEDFRPSVAAEDFSLVNFAGTRLASILNKRPVHAYLRYDPIAVTPTVEDRPLPLPTAERFEEGYRRICQDLAVDREVVEKVVTHLVAGKSVILTGPTGSGKTALAQLIPRVFFDIDTHLVTATADWTSYEVVGGIFPHVETAEDGGTSLAYGVRRGHVYEAVLRNWRTDDEGTLLHAGTQPARRVEERDGTTTVGTWLVIDEFNRADIDKAFGDLFTAIEYRSLRVPMVDPERPGLATRELPIPRHFRILATMNSFDRNYLYAISDALKRRFAFVDVGLPSDLAEERGKVSERVKRHLAEAGIDSDTDLLADAEQVLYEFLGFVRAFRAVGVAQAIAVLQFAAVRSAFGELSTTAHLEDALLADVLPQLENLPLTQLGLLRTWCRGDPKALADHLLQIVRAETVTPGALRDVAAVARHLAARCSGPAGTRCKDVADAAEGPADDQQADRIAQLLRGSVEGDGTPALGALLSEELHLGPLPKVAGRLADYSSEQGY